MRNSNRKKIVIDIANTGNLLWSIEIKKREIQPKNIYANKIDVRTKLYIFFLITSSNLGVIKKIVETNIKI